MFDSKKKNYDQLSLNDFSDDDTDDENDTNTLSDHKNTNKKTANANNNTFPNRISNNNNTIKNTNNFNSISNGGLSSNYSDTQNQHSQQQQQNNILLQKQQDEGLEMLGYSAERLGKMSMIISDEINNQNKLLDEIDLSFDTASENLNYVTTKTKILVDQAGGTKNFLIILSLIGIVLFLLLLILYT